MTVRTVRLVPHVLAALGLLLAVGCGPSGPSGPQPGEVLEAFDLDAPGTVAEGVPFTLDVTAVGSAGTTPFTPFDGTVDLSVSDGTLEPTDVQVTSGEGSVEVTLDGASGSVTITAAENGATGTTNVTVGGLDVLPGDDDDPASEAIPAFSFEAEPDDYDDQAPDLEGVYVSTSVLVIAFAEGTTVAEANALLNEIDAEIVGGIPGVEGEASGIVIVRLSTSTHAEMEATLASLRDDSRVQNVARDALLEGTALPQDNDGTPFGWQWDDPPSGGNYGMELIRAPQLWNLNAAVAKSGNRVATGVLDLGFDAGHEDLVIATDQTPGTVDDHGTHVAGTIAATFDNGIGVDGVTPFADLVVRGPAFSGSGTVLDIRTSWGEQMTQGFFDLVRDRPDIRVVNASLGYNWGPAGIDQDNNTSAQNLVEQQGAIFGLAMLLTVLFDDDFDSFEDLPLFVVAAGNDSNDGFGTQDAKWGSPFTYAGLELDIENIIVAESVALSLGSPGDATRSSFSNLNGFISAPGSNVLSTEPGDTYGVKSGTSMASPHVTGLISYLLAVDPTLTHSEVRDLLTANGVAVAGGASDRIDAFASAMDVDRVQGGDAVLRMLLDIDDGTPDGNQRVLVGTSTDFVGEDADGDGGIGDGQIDMSDFRRFRDWLLQVEGVGGLTLDGSSDHPKKDVNDNGQVETSFNENLYPRGDFNGDGDLSRSDTAYVPGAVDATVTDLAVLQTEFSDPNYAAGDLPGLLDSGDLEIWPRTCLDRSDVASVESSVRVGDSVIDTRTHTSGSTPRQVYTLAVPTPGPTYTATVRALDGSGEPLFTTDRIVVVEPGSDAFWDPACSEETPEPPDGEHGESWGDPHLVTFDGLGYHFQGVGEFVLVESDADDLTIQVRQEPWGSSRRVSVNTAVATEIGGQRVAVYANETTPLWIDGVPVPLSDGESISVGSGQVIRSGDKVVEIYPSGDHLQVRLRAGRMDVEVFLTPDRSGSVAGLLGNADGDTGDDIAMRGGSVFAQPITFGELYGGYADSWRISSAESLFDYGAGESTSTFTDLSFPDATASAGSLEPAVYDAALEECQAAGLTDPFLLDACVIDVGLTGDDGFVDDSAAAGAPDRSLGVTPETYDVAYLHGQDRRAATVYESELEARGFDVSLVLLGSTESSNASLLAAYDLLMIDPFTGRLSNWDGGAKVENAVLQSGVPVLAVGEGGYAFLGKAGSTIGYPNGAHGSALAGMSATSPLHPSLAGPRSVFVSSGSVKVASTGQAYVAIYLPNVGANVEVVGRSAQNYGVELVDTGPSAWQALWGFHGVPSAYTSDGWNTVANLANYLVASP
jgi:subtilisin family serine protease